MNQTILKQITEIVIAHVGTMLRCKNVALFLLGVGNGFLPVFFVVKSLTVDVSSSDVSSLQESFGGNIKC